MADKKGVRFRHRLYEAMQFAWQRCRDCYEGSDAVKARGEEYLPALASHRKAVNQPTRTGKGPYDEYKLRALFYGAFDRTVNGLAGGIFQKTPTVRVPKGCEEHLKDLTLANETAEMFWLHSAQEVLTTGRFGILIEMPSEESFDTRPYWCGFESEHIISWRTERIDGDERLTRVVVREYVEMPDPEDEFATVLEEQYRVLELIAFVGLPEQPTTMMYQQRIYRQDPKKKDEFILTATLVPTRRKKPLEFIPFVFIGPTSVTPKVAKPPLLDLADVILSHYRTMADLEWGRHLVALPTPWIAGMMPSPTTAAGGGDEQEMGPGVVLMLEKEGSAGYVEFTGKGLEALEKADEQKRRLMATLGARLLEEQASAQETATAVGMRHGGEHATLRTVAQALETAFLMAMRWHVWWYDSTKALIEDLKDEVAVELNKDFFAVRMSSEQLKGWVFALQSNAITYATFYQALVRGDVARPGVDWETEKAELDSQEQERLASLPVELGGTGPPLLDADGNPVKNDGAKPGDKPKPGVKKDDEEEEEE